MLRQPKLQKRKPEMKTIFQLRERCWPGYKPTPGKKAYAKGSCVKETITLPSDAPSIQSIAKKHGVSEEEIQKQLEMGLKVEQEHTSDVQAATEIALDHLNEKPDYYTRLKKFVEDIDGTTEQVAGSAQSTLTDKPNREPMKTYKQKNITELSTNLLDRYKEKAAADSAKADKEGNTAKADKRFSGVVKATTKQFDNFKKKGFSEDVEQIDELTKNTLRNYVSKAISDKAKATEKRNNVKYKKTHGDDWNKEVSTNIFDKETKKIKKRTVGLVKAVAKLNNEDITKKPEGFKSLKPKESEHETYYKFIAGKAKLGKPLSTKERSFAQSYKMAREETEQIAEISAQAHKEYQSAARKDIKANLKHIHGEYGDIAKNIVNRRMKGLAMSNAMTKLKKEEIEQIDEKNVPTSPEKWAQAKSQAKAKFDVYPSAYANGWAAKKYKAMGGGWKSVSEAVKDKFDIGEYDQEGDMAKSDLRSIMANAKKLHDMIEDADNLPEWCQNKITLAEDYISTVANYLTAEMNEEVEQIDELKKSTLASYATKATDDAKNKKDAATSYAAQMKGYSSKGMQKSVKADKRIEGVKGAIKRLAKEAKEDLPFTPDKPKKQSVVAGKYGKEYSTARHLARTAMQKQAEKMKKQPIKEESRKAAIVKDIMKKKKGSEDAFQKEPELSSTLTKVQ